jgi:hypothetical protein
VGVAVGLLACVLSGWSVRGLPLAVTILLLVVAVLFGSLTVTVGTRDLVIRFGPGPIGKRWQLAEITDAQAVTNPWWYGWGIRVTPVGWLYNVSGLGAVEIRLSSGKRARIGTDEPERLAAAIRQHRELLSR